MPAQYYIHNIYNKNITSEFGKEQIARQLDYQKKQVASLNAIAKSQYTKMFGDNQDYVKAVEELSKILPQASREMVTQLPTLDFSKIRQALGVSTTDVETSITMLQNAITKMENDISQYEELYNNIIDNNGNPNKPTWFSQKDLDRLQKQVQKLSKAKEDLKKLDVHNDDKWHIAKVVGTAASTAAGYISEYGLTNILNVLYKNKNIKVQQIGTTSEKGKKAYTVGTTDVSVMLTDNDGKILVKLPGITLKRTATGQRSKQPVINIHLKSTSVGKLIELSKMENGSGQFPLKTFYNAYANANRTTRNFKTQEEVVNKVVGMRNMYQAFKMAALATALTGSMSASDFAYYLVINDQVYTASEIIMGVISGSGQIVNGQVKSTSADEILNSTAATTLEKAQPALAERHTWLLYNKYLTAEDDQKEADARSAEVINLINNLNISLNLKMNLAELTRSL